MEATELYNEFTDQIEQMLLSIIRKSKVKSKHYNAKVIKIDINIYTELGVIDNNLRLCDSDGYQYDIYSLDLSDLCNIIDKNI